VGSFDKAGRTEPLVFAAIAYPCEAAHQEKSVATSRSSMCQKIGMRLIERLMLFSSGWRPVAMWFLSRTRALKSRPFRVGAN
jgi:hypothetical protein